MAKKKIEEGILDKIKTAMGGGELPDLIVNHTANAIEALGEYASSKEGADRGGLFKEDLEPLLGAFNKKLNNSDDNFKYRAAFLAELLSQYAGGQKIVSLKPSGDSGALQEGKNDREFDAISGSNFGEIDEMMEEFKYIEDQEDRDNFISRHGQDKFDAIEKLLGLNKDMSDELYTPPNQKIQGIQEGSFRISKEKINQIISEEIRRYKRKK